MRLYAEDAGQRTEQTGLLAVAGGAAASGTAWPTWQSLRRGRGSGGSCTAAGPAGSGGGAQGHCMHRCHHCCPHYCCCLQLMTRSAPTLRCLGGEAAKRATLADLWAALDGGD